MNKKYVLPILLTLPFIFTSTASASSTLTNYVNKNKDTKKNNSEVSTLVRSSLYAEADGTGNGSVSGWKYKYTADPYAVFYNVFTKEYRVIQVTSIMTHTINTVIGGYANYNPIGHYYNYEHAKMAQYL